MPSSDVSASRAVVLDLGEYPPGGDSDILIAMDPVEDTTSLAITADFSLTRNGSPVLTLTTADGEITTGEGTNKEKIRLKMVHADTTAFDTNGNGTRYWLHARITTSGDRDRIVIGTINFKGPAV